MSGSASQKTVMIVDDEVFFRRILREMLEKEGFSVAAEAVDGAEAVKCFKECRPAVVVMDIYMPNKSGMDATKEILLIDGNAKVVICSGQGYDEDARAALGVGARYVLQKPFIKDEVLDIVNKLVSE